MSHAHPIRPPCRRTASRTPRPGSPSGWELADLLLATERLPGFRHTFLSTLQALIRLRGNRPEMRLSADQLARIEQPAAIFWGADDPFGSPEVGERMAAAMPHAELHGVGGGHGPWLTQAERIGPIARRFLREHGGPDRL